jgi:hypothetical protein
VELPSPPDRSSADQAEPPLSAGDSSSDAPELPSSSEAPAPPSPDSSVAASARPDHYIDYRRYHRDVESVFSDFRDPMPWGGLARIIDGHPEFPPPTIYSWYRTWRRRPFWRPDETDRSLNHRKFTDEQEQAIDAEITSRYLSTHRRLSCRQFKGFTISFWQRQRIGETKTVTFAGSSRFRIGFQRRHGLSLRTATLKKKEADRNPVVIAQYLERVRAARAKYGANRVVNMDETAWKDVQIGGKTIARKGAKSVHIVANGDTKSGMTVIATISAAAEKLPLIYILRADSDRSLPSLMPAVDPSRVTRTTNGWMDNWVMLKYLSWLHYAMNDEPCALVMDSFPGHVTAAVSQKADFLDIEIIPVPEGLTGEFQPLDRSGFGPLKKISQALWDERAARDPHLRWSHQEAAKILEVAWAQLPPRVLESAWRFKVLEQYGLTGQECEAEFTNAPFHVKNWPWEEKDEEGEEEEESRVDDGPYGLVEYNRDRAQQSDSDDDEPGSSDTCDGQNRRLEIARLRGTAKQKVDRSSCLLISLFTRSTPMPRHGQENQERPEKNKISKRQSSDWVHTRRSVPVHTADGMANPNSR